MDNEERQAYLEKIIEEIDKTKALLRQLKDASKPEGPDNAIGRISQMDAINIKSITDNQLRQNELKLQRLELILSKKHSESLGKCVNCEKEINFKRLMYRPDSRLCIQCAN